MPDNPFEGRLSRGKDPFAGVGKVLERIPTKERSKAKYSKDTRPGSHQSPVQQSVGTGLDLGEKEVNVTTTAVGTKWEIFKKVSNVIITQQDVYEEPPDWDDTDASPTWDTGLPDPTEPWFKLERVHEIGYITENSEIIIEKFNIPVETAGSDPYAQSVSLVVAERHINGPPENQIPLELLSSAEAVEAIAKAQGETTGTP